MKTKIVLWGTTEKEEKILVAIELVESENLVKTFLVDEADATEIFYNRMLNEWRFGTEIEFPENTKTFSKELTASDDILPEGIKVDRPDLVIRAKTEWHFVVLSKKLYDLYKGELEDLKEKIGELSEFDNSLWEEMKGFWSKVQVQIREKNLFRNHVENLRQQTDEAFHLLKEFKKKADKEIREESKKHFDEFSEILEKVEEKIENGLGLQPLFEQLKVIQTNFKNTGFSREHRRQLWDRIDKSFKNIKEKRFGNSPSDRTPLARLTRRYEGLLNAIEKMQRSIARDKKDLQIQDNRASSSFGQLELEIRKVKMSMVEERVLSKEEKLNDMLKTKEMLESRIKSEQEKEAKRVQYEEAKKEAKDKIALEMKESSAAMEDQEDDLKIAAEKIATAANAKKESKEDKKEDKKGILDKISDKIEEIVEEAEEIVEDVVDTVKAVAHVVEEKVEEKLEGLDDKVDKVEDDLDGKKEKLGDKIEEVVDTIEDKIEEVAEKIEDQIEEVVDKVKDKVKAIFNKEEEE